MKWYIRLFKLMNEPIFYIFYFIIFFLSVCTIQAFVLLAFRFQCSAAQQTVTQAVTITLIVTFVVIGFILFLLELIINFDSIKRYEFTKILRSDPYYFRVEVYFFTLCGLVPFYFVYLILSLFTSIDNVYELTLFSITFFFIYLILIGFPIFTTILRLITTSLQNKGLDENKSALETLLSTDEGFELMYKTCQMEYSLENLSCWKDIQNYKKEKNFEDRKKKYQKILQLYLSGSSSEMEINISSETLHSTIQKGKEETFEPEMLKDFELAVTLNLRDTFMRLSNSTEYKIFLSHQKLMVDTNMAKN